MYYSVTLGAQCSNRLIRQLVHVVLISVYLLLLMKGKKEKSECPWRVLVLSLLRRKVTYSLHLTSKFQDLTIRFRLIFQFNHLMYDFNTCKSIVLLMKSMQN